MSRLQPEKLHVTLSSRIKADGPMAPRCYTLTHSDLTGELFLTIDSAYDKKQISGLYTRLMRDEVLTEWRTDEGAAMLHVHCHVSGGVALEPPGMRLAIFAREMPLVLEAFRFGDRSLFEAHPRLDDAPILVHFHARQPRHNRVEKWGTPADYDHLVRHPSPLHSARDGHPQRGT
ncbi:MAG: staygreen family protein [Chloroflexota bacterium]|nr:staygreen family protein [Chloroflexota bacterium]